MVESTAVSSKGANGGAMLIIFLLLLIFFSFPLSHESQKRKMERACTEIEIRGRLKTVTLISKSVFRVL